MREYMLKTSCGDVINKVMCVDMETAVEFFAIMKQLSIDELLHIFNVE